MRNNYHKSKRAIRGQVAVELAVFGAILIFVIGTIVNRALSNSHQQNQSLRAMRTAMKTSFEHSEGLEGGGGGWGNSSRNVASVFFVEDRLSASSNKYGAMDRVPQMNFANGTHTRNMYLPLDKGETWNIPVVDVFVNGKHFAFTTAGFREDFNLTDPGTNESRTLFTKIPNHPLSEEWCSGQGGVDCTTVTCDPPPCPAGTHFSADKRFDLDRDGGFEPLTEPGGAFRDEFSWQWYDITYLDMDTEGGEYLSADVDYFYNDPINDMYDGDHFEESVVALDKETGIVTVLDGQLGDLNFHEEPRPGFGENMMMLSVPTGETYFQVNEGKLGAGPEQFISTASKKNQVDIIQREFRISNNTGRFCDPATGLPEPLVDGEPNPIEQCDDCFVAHNMERTCMDTESLVIFIRSRVQDLHGRKWVTDVSDDESIEFAPPPAPY